MDFHSLVAISGLFGLGILHGVGPDHLAALGTLATRRGNLREAISVAVRFGAGHAALLAVGAGLALGIGLVIPEAFERAAEIFGGSVVALLGLAALVDALGLRVHSHEHGSAGGSHDHLHVHVGPGRHDPSTHGMHRHGATLIGALLAVSGLRGLLLLLPAAAAGSAWVVGASVAAFGLGVMASMVGAALLGVLTGRLGEMAGIRTGPRVVRGLVGGASFCIGAAWIAIAW